MEYDIEITITGDSNMVEINIRQRPNGELLCYGGADPKDIPALVESAISEFLVELRTGYHP